MNESVSDWAAIKIGIPQGSVLCPILFMAFINDLPGAVSSTCAMYADNIKVHSPVINSEDGDKLQKDLDAMVNWADTWQLHFNTDKCKVLHMGEDNEQCCYKVENMGAVLAFLLKIGNREGSVCSDGDILRFSQHIETQISKANRLLGLTRRSYEHLNAVNEVNVCCICTASLRIW